MSYIWENYSSKKKFHMMEKISPYREAVDVSEYETIVNPFLRFQKIFNQFTSLSENDEFNTSEFSNVIFHFLAKLDLCSGYTDMIAECSYLNEEISNGFMGSETQTLWKNLNFRDKLIFLYYLRQKILSGNKESYFFIAASQIFTVSALYKEKSTDRYYIFIGSRKTAKNERMAALLENFFWNMKQNLEWVWEYHFGIIGHDPTMCIDHIQIL